MIIDDWISVEERLPSYTDFIGDNKISDHILVHDGVNTYTAYLEAVAPEFEVKIWSFDCFDTEDNTEIFYGKLVTHWMPLPPKPKN